MKSIKEKATEYDKVVKRISANKSIVDVSGREQFEAGANYVLECLERAIELNESTFVYSREKYIKVEVLNKLIEQLKK